MAGGPIGGRGPNRVIEFARAPLPYADGVPSKPVGAFVSNTSAPQIANYALIAGLGFFCAPLVAPPPARAAVPIVKVAPQFDSSVNPSRVWPSTVAPQGQANATQYTFGLHAQAIHQAEGAKSSVWSSVPTPPAAAQPVPQRFLWSAPQSIDLTQRNLVQPSVAVPPSAPQPVPLRLIFASQEQLDLSISSWVVGGAQANQGPVPPTIFSSQDNPWQIQPAVWKAAVTPPVLASGIPPTILAGPQTDPTQGLTQVWKSQPATVAVAPSQATFFSIPPQTEDRQTRAVWKSLVAGPAPSIIPSFYAAPQPDPSQLAAQLWPSVRTPPVFTGPTVWPALVVPAQFDPSINPTQLWTTSTFSPGLTPPIPPAPVILDSGVRHHRPLIIRAKDFEKREDLAAFLKAQLNLRTPPVAPDLAIVPITLPAEQSQDAAAIAAAAEKAEKDRLLREEQERKRITDLNNMIIAMILASYDDQ